MTPAELSTRLEVLARTLPDQLRRTLTASALDAEAEAKQNATTRLNVRTGRLRASIQGTVEQDGGGSFSIVLRAGTPDGGRVPYARIHEEGGTIRPKRGRFLKIPVGPALTGAGVSRLPPGRSGGFRFVPTPRGGVLVGRDGQVWFVLKQQVTIPARPYLAPAIATIQPRLADDLTRLLRRALGDA